MTKKSGKEKSKARDLKARRRVAAQARRAYDEAMRQARRADGRVVASTRKAREEAVAQALRAYDKIVEGS